MMYRAMIASMLLGLAITCHAEGTLFKVPTREGVTTTLFWEPVPDAKATVFLLPGGGRGFGQLGQIRRLEQHGDQRQRGAF